MSDKQKTSPGNGLSRRSLLAAGAAATVVGGSVLKPRASFAQGSGGLERELVFSARGGTIGTVYRTKIIPPFEAKFNCKVTMVVNDSGPAFAKVVAEKANPQTDVLWTVEPTHARGLAEGVFDKLDLKRVTNYERLHSFAQLDGYGASWGIGATVIGYNKKIFDERKLTAPTKWGGIVTPETKTHISWLDLSTHQGITTFLMTNRSLGGDVGNVDPVFKFLKENVANLQFISSPAQVDDLLLQQQAWIGTNLDARMALLKAKGFPLQIVYPSDGLPIQSGILNVIKGAPHPNLANEFVNWVLSDEMQLIVARDIQLGPSNKNVKIPPEVAENLIYGEERVSRLLNFDYAQVARELPKWLDRWNREIT
ncbi:extracellular solute-binding protein [Bosea sp. (in: a-proteobacteria)]|uniref:extracellular solute-binding protein n=1 Tax=Bosea sp. (in: a-proteobacteria) TaxID=1871050 RepID=UPI00262281C4|nr:extracellular solute-binding protein [Bosea sp. (in: a-proteobacteria)]MCO5089575.1 extracellular solute-binding protein [Bosea sp. (in: a-proteobacteria)]